jgi:hypothetical protein
VAVFGSGDAQAGDELYQLAMATGRRLAQLGYAVVSGGYGGVMEACSRGAKEAGGRTLGVTCDIWRSAPNAYLDEVVRTSDLAQRVAKLHELAGAGFVVLPGANGTLSELALTWELKSMNRLGDDVPLVCVGEFWHPVVAAVCSIRPQSLGCIHCIAELAELERFFPPRRV